MLELTFDSGQQVALAASSLKRYALRKILPAHQRVLGTAQHEVRKASKDPAQSIWLSDREAMVVWLAMSRLWESEIAHGRYKTIKRPAQGLIKLLEAHLKAVKAKGQG